MSVAAGVAGALAAVGAQVLERGWLSSNNVLFDDGDGDWSVVDTGYVAHASQTMDLLERTVRSGRLRRILNTHLHSDHCGGNRAIQARWGSEVWVPSACHAAARQWDAERLTFEATGQRCERFRVDGAVAAGDWVRLARRDWQALAAPGHDATALMFFQPEERVLIAGDALWQDRLAVVFPEIDGDDGFGDVEQVLSTIEALRPAVVIPGHGAPFDDVAAALAASRARLGAFQAEPQRHRAYAARALLMFRLLELRRVQLGELLHWLAGAPTLQRLLNGGTGAPSAAEGLGLLLVDRLVADGLLRRDGEWISVAG